MKNKTIFDAVNELRGDLNNGIGGSKGNETHLWYNNLKRGFGTAYVIHGKNREYKTIGTTQQFNALVEEMKLGLGVNKVTHSELFDYLYSAKQLLEPTKPGSNTYTKEVTDKRVNDKSEKAHSKARKCLQFIFIAAMYVVFALLVKAV